MNVVDIKSKQITPRSLLENELKNVDDIDNLIIIPIDKKGNIDIGYTSMYYAQIVGYLEVMKQEILDMMRT